MLCKQKQEIMRMMRQHRSCEQYLNAFSQILIFSKSHQPVNHLQMIMSMCPNMNANYVIKCKQAKLQTTSRQSLNQSNYTSLNSSLNATNLEQFDERIQHYKQIYNQYCPTHEQEAEINKIVLSLNQVSSSVKGTAFMDLVFEAYKNKNGIKNRNELENKIVYDLLFTIKRENQKQANKYPPSQ